jgi:hypothetical protein
MESIRLNSPFHHLGNIPNKNQLLRQNIQTSNTISGKTNRNKHKFISFSNMYSLKIIYFFLLVFFVVVRFCLFSWWRSDQCNQLSFT